MKTKKRFNTRPLSGIGLFLSLVLFSHAAFALDRSTQEHWRGKWDSLPTPVENPSTYYYYELTPGTEGFSWKSINRDVPYRPNEEINTGAADFVSGTEALDKANQLVFLLGKDAAGKPTLTVRTQTQATGGEIFYAEPKFYLAGFDCAKASTVIENAICSDRRLAMADLQINQLYQKLRKSLTGAELKAIKTSQRRWIKHRNRCTKDDGADQSCLALSYAHRLATLQKSANPALGSGEGVNTSYLAGLQRLNEALNKNMPLLLVVACVNRDWAIELMKYPVNYTMEKEPGKTLLIGHYAYDTVCWPDDCVIEITLSISADSGGKLDVTRSQQSRKK